MSKVIRTATEVKAILAETYIPDSHWEDIGIDPNKHFHDLTAEEVATLSEAYIENSRRELVEFNAETVPVLYGLREAGEGEVSWLTIGKRKYIADNNAINRMLSEARANEMSKVQQAGLFATSTDMAVSSSKQFVNGAHRGAATAKTLEVDPTYKVVIPIVFGVPPQLRDLWDFKNKEKKLKDILYQNPGFMPKELLATGWDGEAISPLTDEPTPQEVVAYRNKLSSEYPSFVGFTLMRLSGTHIHGHADDRDILRFKEHRCSDAEQLAYEVFRRAHGADGKKLDQFKHASIAQWASVLLLASNRDSDDSSELSVDWKLVQEVLDALLASTQSAGPFAKLLSGLAANMTVKKKLPRKGIYDALVIAVKDYLEHGEVVSNCIRTETQLKGKTYPTFGGVDIGHQEEVAA